MSLIAQKYINIHYRTITFRKHSMSFKALMAQITLICGELTCVLVKDGIPRILQMVTNQRIPHIDGSAVNLQDAVLQKLSSPV